MMGLPGREISLTIIFSRLDTIDKVRTKRQTDTERQQRPRLYAHRRAVMKLAFCGFPSAMHITAT